MKEVFENVKKDKGIVNTNGYEQYEGSEVHGRWVFQQRISYTLPYLQYGSPGFAREDAREIIKSTIRDTLKVTTARSIRKLKQKQKL